MTVKQQQFVFLFRHRVITGADYRLIFFIIYFFTAPCTNCVMISKHILMFASHNQLIMNAISNVVNILISAPGKQMLMYAFFNTIS